MQEQTFSIFQEVVELDPEARNAYYRTHHVADDVRQEVESLLQFDTEEDSLSEDIAAAVKEILEESEAPSQPGMCGPYRLVQKIGEGGMGTVYLGERADGEVEQRVAIKIVRSGADTPSFRARFLRERRIVASLNHPGIARVIDAGHTAEGQPYLVMEYIEGVPLDKYCAGLEPSAALRLFLQACEAVSYAHRNLVIHRDLKPSNILVDGAGRLKLLDFGIARILDGSEETRTLVQALTPGYASPEQIRGEAQTTATDIYSLGAVLYKVLSGQTPQSGPPGATSAIVPPSQVKPGLSRDIDFIILRALRRNPDVLWTLVAKIGVSDFVRGIESPSVLFLLIAFHVAASVLSFWVQRTESYNWMWATALIPAPIVWLLILETSLLPWRGLGVVAPQFIFFGVASLWATSMFAAIFRTRHGEMPLDDLDFAVFFGSLSHWLVMCAVPLTVLVLH